MPNSTRCPACGAVWMLTAGKPNPKVRCTKCQTVFRAASGEVLQPGAPAASSQESSPRDSGAAPDSRIAEEPPPLPPMPPSKSPAEELPPPLPPMPPREAWTQAPLTAPPPAPSRSDPTESPPVPHPVPAPARSRVKGQDRAASDRYESPASAAMSSPARPAGPPLETTPAIVLVTGLVVEIAVFLGIVGGAVTKGSPGPSDGVPPSSPPDEGCEQEAWAIIDKSEHFRTQGRYDEAVATIREGVAAYGYRVPSDVARALREELQCALLEQLLQESRQSRSSGMAETRKRQLLAALQNALLGGCADLRKAVEEEMELLQAFSATPPAKFPPSTVVKPPPPVVPPKTAAEIERIQRDVDHALNRGKSFEIDRHPELARKVYRALIDKYPDEPMAQPVRDALEALQKDPK